MNLESDPRVGKAGAYRYCRRCGTFLDSPTLAAFHFGDRKWTAGGAKGQEYSRVPCSGKPVGRPQDNPAPGTKCADLDAQEARPARLRTR